MCSKTNNANGVKNSSSLAKVNDQVINNVKNAKGMQDYDYSLCKTVLDFTYMWCAKHYGVGKLGKYTVTWSPRGWWSEKIKCIKDIMNEECGIKATNKEIEENLIKAFEMTLNVKYSTKILDEDGHRMPVFKVIKEEEVVKDSNTEATLKAVNDFFKTAKAVNDIFKTAKSVHAFNGEVLSIKVDENKDGDKITIETKDFWAMVYTNDTEVNILLKTNFLTDDMVGDITFIDQNKNNIVSSYNKSKQAA